MVTGCLRVLVSMASCCLYFILWYVIPRVVMIIDLPFWGYPFLRASTTQVDCHCSWNYSFNLLLLPQSFDLSSEFKVWNWLLFEFLGWVVHWIKLQLQVQCCFLGPACLVNVTRYDKSTVNCLWFILFTCPAHYSSGHIFCWPGPPVASYTAFISVIEYENYAAFSTHSFLIIRLIRLVQI